MNNSRNTVIRQLLVSATTLAFISSSVHAESWSRSEDDPYMKYSVGNITIGGPLRGLTTEELNQIVTSIRNIFEDVEVPEVPNPTDLATWRTEEFNNQHGLGLIGVEYRYIKGATGKNTLGVVYGSGIDLDHKDLGKIRADLNHSYGDDPTDLSDSSSGHGTFVYGVAGAARNDVGIHGVAPDAEFMILKRKPINTLVDFPDALKRAMNADADVMINSWAGVGLNQSHITPELEEQLNRIPQGDISIVFAAGNFKNPDPHYLARLPVEYPDLKGNWLAVTALGLNSDGSYKLWDGSDKCGTAKDWCLAAPGADIRSLLAGGGTKVESGTSVSAPHVAGAILVLRSQFPESTIPEIHQILFDTAIDLGDEGIDSTFGHGALNLGEAMTPQGALMAEMDPQLNQRTSSLNDSGITESSVTNGVLAKAMSNQSIFVTDRYDRGFFASLAPRIATGSVDKQAGLRAAFTSDLPPDTRETGFGLRLNAFGASHDVTRIAHADPIMTLMSETSQTEFSMQIPSGKATLSMSSVTSTDGNAFSLGAGLPFGKGHIITVSAGHARETDSILGAKTRGAFAGLKSNTVYGRAQADFALGKHVTLNSSVTSGQTSFRSTGLLSQGRADTLAMASR